MAIITLSEKCTGCGACIKTCPQMILALNEDKKMFVKEPERCMACFGCEDECKFGAVYIKKGASPDIPAEKIKVEENGKIAAEYDVVVIGAGPSGLGTAIGCAQQGLKTAVFERLPNREVSHHNDGGILFSYPAAVTIKKTDGFLELPEFDFKLKDDFINSKIEWLGMEGPDGYCFNNQFKKGLEGYICLKDKLVHELVDKAERSGVNIFFNTRVKDVIREDEKIVGIKILDGPDVRSKVLVTADGILARFSAKSKIPVNKETHSYIQYQTIFYERPKELSSGFAYLMGGLNLGEGTPPAIGCVGVGDHIEISLIMYSKKKFYEGKQPLDHYVKKMLEQDERIRKYLGDHVDSLKYHSIKGTRLRVRTLCKEVSVDGAVAVGDNWVSGAQLGNINSIANGLFTSKAIKKAFEANDFSKESLGNAAKFINKDVEMFVNQIAKMTDYPVEMDEETVLDYFKIFHRINYPTLFYGSKKQIMGMMMGIMFRSIFKLMAKPKMFKYM